MKSKMSLWAKVVLWTVAVINAALTVWGIYEMLNPVDSFWNGWRPHLDAPYFGIVFVVMTLINITLLVLFLVATFQLFRLKPSAVMLHSIASASVVAYFMLNALLWGIRPSISTSIAAATGVGNMGLAPFLLLFHVPTLYPIASTIVLLICS
jgi:hypothetical protein